MIRLKILSNNNTSFRASGEFKIHYKIGETAEAIPGTIGITCFDNLQNIRNFLRWDLTYTVDIISTIENTTPICGKIYLVETFDEIETPELITYAGFRDIREYNKYTINDIMKIVNKDQKSISDLKIFGYTHRNNLNLQKPKEGTICARKVKLLELKYYIVPSVVPYD